MNFKDEDGMIHHVVNPERFSSENWQMFTGLYIILRGMLEAKMEIETRSSYFKRIVKFNVFGGKLSHDNRTGYEMGLGFSYQPEVYKLKDRIWLHPRDLLTYIGVKNKWKWIGILLFPFHWLTFYQETKTRGNVTMFKTDGKMLALARMSYFGSHRQMAIFSGMLLRNRNFGSWYGVFRRYFCQNQLFEERYPNGKFHPLVILALKLDQELGIEDSIERYERDCLR